MVVAPNLSRLSDFGLRYAQVNYSSDVQVENKEGSHLFVAKKAGLLKMIDIVRIMIMCRSKQ